MEEVGKMSKIKFFLFLILLVVQTPAFADFQLPIRNYNQSSQIVYLDTLGVISASGFRIIEMQSKSGLVYFASQDMQFLAKVFSAGSSSFTGGRIAGSFCSSCLIGSTFFSIDF